MTFVSRAESGATCTMSNGYHCGESGKEENVIFNDALNTFYLDIWCQTYVKGPFR